MSYWLLGPFTGKQCFAKLEKEVERSHERCQTSFLAPRDNTSGGKTASIWTYQYSGNTTMLQEYSAITGVGSGLSVRLGAKEFKEHTVPLVSSGLPCTEATLWSKQYACT